MRGRSRLESGKHAEKSIIERGNRESDEKGLSPKGHEDTPWYQRGVGPVLG